MQKESDSMKKIEKQCIPKVMDLFLCKVNVKSFWFLLNFYQNIKMVKNVAWTTMDVVILITGEEKYIQRKKDALTCGQPSFFFNILLHDWHRQWCLKCV